MPFQPFEKLWLLKHLEHRKVLVRSYSSLPTATHTIFAKTFWRKIDFDLNSEDQRL